MAIIDHDSKVRMEKFVEHQLDFKEQDEADSEDVFLDLCRVLIFMLVVFAIVYGVWLDN